MEVPTIGSSHFISTKSLLAFRVMALIYWIISILIGVGHSFYGLAWFEFLTNWGLIGLVFYFFTASIVSYFTFCQKEIPKLLESLYNIQFAMIITIPWLVTIGYWALLNDLFTAQTTDLGRYSVIVFNCRVFPLTQLTLYL